MPEFRPEQDLPQFNRLAEPRHRAAVVSTFFAAAYLGLGLPAVLTGLISQLISTVDASDHYFPWLKAKVTPRTHGACSARLPRRPTAFP